MYWSLNMMYWENATEKFLQVEGWVDQIDIWMISGEADSSSTSPPSSLSESAASSSSSASTSPLLNRNGRRKRKESDTELEGSHQDADNDCPQPNPMKRAREDSDATESPACAATAPIESPLSLAAYKVSRSQAEPTSPRNQAPTSPRNHAPSSPSLRPSPPPVDPVAQWHFNLCIYWERNLPGKGGNRNEPFFLSFLSWPMIKTWSLIFFNVSISTAGRTCCWLVLFVVLYSSGWRSLL